MHNELDCNSESYKFVVESRVVFDVFKTEWASSKTMESIAICQNLVAPSQLSHQHTSAAGNQKQQ